jgi:hypothetical protein
MLVFAIVQNRRDALGGVDQRAEESVDTSLLREPQVPQGSVFNQSSGI